MDHPEVAAPSNLLRRLTIPVGLAVAVIVVLAWYVTWVSSDLAMMLISQVRIGSIDLALFFALIVVMMIAMMLPSALPMALAHHGLTRLESGGPTKPADTVATIAFLVPYFIVWALFGVAALLGLIALGLIGFMLMGPAILVSAATLIAAGLWQVTRTKEVCLSHCTSPMGFVLQHWRSGRIGAMRMGFRHSMYCIGCCWLFMLVLFISGSMSLAWMGGLSVAIFVEKLGVRQVLFTRAIGIALVGIGVLVAARAIAPM
jgi:predicted metal-binding membrane protein